MIKGVHTMFYSSDPEATRDFLRDKLGFPYSDVGGGWLIFYLPEADMGCHPSSESGEQGEPADAGFGLVTQISVPGGISVQLYQPHYEKSSS